MRSDSGYLGGSLPLGYDLPTDLTTRALVTNAAEAETVRLIFSRYLELGSVHALERWVNAQGIHSKIRTPAKGRSRGGAPIGRGALFHLLKNRTYLGEIPHRDRTYPGAHEAIIDPAVFEEVQRLLAAQARRHEARPTRVSAMPLRGMIFDADGSPMSPTFTHGSRGQVYRYYVSAPLQAGTRRVATLLIAVRSLLRQNQFPDSPVFSPCWRRALAVRLRGPSGRILAGNAC